jgi:hypothetical protein
VAGGAGSIPRIDFYRPALSLGGAEPGCLMTLGTSILLELIPSEAIELVDLFVLPTETPDGVERLVLGGNQWSMTADTPENRAVMRALASLEHAEVATGTVASIVPPDLGFRYTDPDELYDLGFDPSALQLRLIDVVHEAIREGRVVWDASEHAPVSWFANGPDALPEVLRELDQGRAAARR